MGGTRIGDYVVERQLAAEDTGLVYLARHVVLPRRAAIKVMHAEQAWLREVAVQMLREACMLEAVSSPAHPGIPRVYECGVLPDKRPWAAYEWVDGETLGAALDAGPIAIADLVVMLRDVADVLAHTHERGVVHRRLTASAIARTPERRTSVMIREWGDARAFDTAAQVEVEPRDDVHALGVIVFRALTGSMPSSLTSTSDLCPSAPRELTALIDHMLATDPRSRPTSAEVRDRAGWLATTLELVGAAPRWTPPQGVARDSFTAEDPSGFAIRISRPPTR